MEKLLLFVLVVFLLSKCEKKAGQIALQSRIKNTIISDVKKTQHPIPLKKEVPILCYDNFTESANTIITLSHERFEEHIRSLVDSGYHGILPDQLYDYLTAKADLPSKPVMISFDGSRLTQYTIAAPILEIYGLRGVFFIMTVCVNKAGYMSSTMINDLETRGHAIGVHTYDHPLVSDIQSGQWNKELKEPKIFLENAIHNEVSYFAFPYGPWTEPCIEHLIKDGYKAAFQLRGKQSVKYPLYTIRRLKVEGYWSAEELHKKMKKTFNNPETAIN